MNASGSRLGCASSSEYLQFIVAGNVWKGLFVFCSFFFSLVSVLVLLV